MAKKFCQCGKFHTTAAAKTRCFRARIPNYGVSDKKIVSKEVEVLAESDIIPDVIAESNIVPEVIAESDRIPDVIAESDIIPTLELRNREVQKVQMSQLDIDKARKNLQADGQERFIKYKNVLWANALKIQERLQSQVEKKTKVQALKILWNSQQALWFIIGLYIQKRVALQHAPQIPEDDEQLWEQYYLDTHRVRRVLVHTQTRDMLRQYYSYCLTNGFLLGQAASFQQGFRQLGDLILPLTETKYRLLLRQQYQFYFALQGSHQCQLTAVMNYLKKKGYQRLLKQQPHFKVNASTKAAAKKVINRLAVTAFYYFNGASNVRQIVLFRSIFNWMLRLICLYHQKRGNLLDYYRQKLEMTKDKEDVFIIIQPPKDRPIQQSLQQTKPKQASRTWLTRHSEIAQTKKQRQQRLEAAEAEALRQKRALLDLRKQKRRIRALNSTGQEKKKTTHMDQITITHRIAISRARSEFNKKRYL